MSRRNLTVRLVGRDEDRGVVDFDDFQQLCRGLMGCLRRAEQIVTDKPPHLRYRIVGLNLGSARVEVQAVAPSQQPQLATEVVALFAETVTKLEGGEQVDPRWRREDLEGLRDIARPLQAHSKQLWIDDREVTLQLVANVEKLLRASVASEGFIAGFVEGLNVHNRNEFSLYPVDESERVTCAFPPELFEDVRGAIKRHVTVWGTLYYHEQASIPYRIDVEGLKIHPRDEELPTLDDVRRLGKWDTDGLCAVDFVRKIRDEQD